MIVFDKKLRERAFGIFENKPYQAFYDAQGKASNASFGFNRDFKPEGGGESMNDVSARAKDFLVNTIVSDHFAFSKKVEKVEDKDVAQYFNSSNAQVKSGDKHLLLVSHGGYSGQFIDVVRKLKDNDNFKVYDQKLKNTCLNIFKITQDVTNLSE